jgi:hypothetical protein
MASIRHGRIIGNHANQRTDCQLYCSQGKLTIGWSRLSPTTLE